MNHSFFKLIFISFLFTVVSCGTQKTYSHLQSGNNVEAFNNAILQLSKDKSKKSKQKQIPLLKEAFTKAAASNLAEIKSLQKIKTPENLKKIYGNYLNLDLRQDEVKILQPLYYEGNEVEFPFENYTQKIAIAKRNYSEILYSTSQKLMKGNTLDARKAYSFLNDLLYVNASYNTNIKDLIQKAKKQRQ